MKRITVFLFACLLVALPFSSLYAQKIDFAMFYVEEGSGTNHTEGEKFSETTFTTKKLNSDRVIEITANELVISLTKTEVGKYKISPSYLAEEKELPANYTAMRYSYFGAFSLDIENNSEAENTKKDCEKYGIPLQGELEITKSENGKISGTFTTALFNPDCSYFMINCITIVKGTFTDLKVD